MSDKQDALLTRSLLPHPFPHSSQEWSTAEAETPSSLRTLVSPDPAPVAIPLSLFGVIEKNCSPLSAKKRPLKKIKKMLNFGVLLDGNQKRFCLFVT